MNKLIVFEKIQAFLNAAVFRDRSMTKNSLEQTVKKTGHGNVFLNNIKLVGGYSLKRRLQKLSF